MKIDLYAPDLTKTIEIPLIETPLSCGFPSPALDYLENKLDVVDYLIQHPSATFFAIARGTSMSRKIDDGDLLVIDRSVAPTGNKIVLAVVEGNFTVKTIKKYRGKIYLIPDSEDSSHKPTEVTEAMDFRVWGVITKIIKSV